MAHGLFDAKVIAIYGLALSSLACVLPLSHTEVRAPNVIGTYRHSDGSSIPSSEIVMAVRYGDQTCTQRDATAVTDTSGRCHVQGATVRHPWMLLMPGYDRARPTYNLCSGRTDSILRPRYRRCVARPDSVDCFAWAWGRRSHVTCDTHREKRLFNGGHWTEGNTKGHLRVVYTENVERTAESHQRHLPSRMFVQWGEHVGVDSDAVIRAPVDLPTDSTVIPGLHPPVFSERADRWFLRLDAIALHTNSV